VPTTDVVVSATPEHPFRSRTSGILTDRGFVISVSYWARSSHMVVSATLVRRIDVFTSEMLIHRERVICLSHQFQTPYMVVSAIIIYDGNTSANEIGTLRKQVSPTLRFRTNEAGFVSSIL
jgi:hypothetical protein